MQTTFRQLLCAGQAEIRMFRAPTARRLGLTLIKRRAAQHLSRPFRSTRNTKPTSKMSDPSSVTNTAANPASAATGLQDLTRSNFAPTAPARSALDSLQAYLVELRSAGGAYSVALESLSTAMQHVFKTAEARSKVLFDTSTSPVQARKLNKVARMFVNPLVSSLRQEPPRLSSLSAETAASQKSLKAEGAHRTHALFLRYAIAGGAFRHPSSATETAGMGVSEDDARKGSIGFLNCLYGDLDPETALGLEGQAEQIVGDTLQGSEPEVVALTLEAAFTAEADLIRKKRVGCIG